MSKAKVILDPRIPWDEPEAGEAFIGCHGALDGRGVAATDDVGHDALVPLAGLGGGWIRSIIYSRGHTVSPIF